MAGTRIVEHREVRVVRRAVPARAAVPVVSRPSVRAYRILRAGYALLFLLAGMDKFLNFTAAWETYLAKPIEAMLPVPAEAFMRFVGVFEIALGALIAVAPRVGGPVAALWLAAIAVNLVLPPGFYDIAVRDAGLVVGAVALAVIAQRRRRAVVVRKETV